MAHDALDRAAKTDATGRPKSREAVTPPRVDTLSTRFGALVRFVAVLWTFFKALLLMVAERLALRRLWYRLCRKPYERMTRAKRLRLAFEDLGPTYIKLGQIIASSEGLFPADLSREFRNCLDRVPPFPISGVRHIVRSDFGKGADQIFTRLDPEPIAAASIAQVHVAELEGGREVVVKVQRPHLRRRVAADVRIMLFIARLLERVSYRARLANMVGIIADFGQTISEEMEFRLEALNMDDFNAIFASREGNRICAPRVYWRHTTQRVLTMERFRGWRVDDVEAMKAMEDTEAQLVAGLLAWFESILTTGIFHGDVHAGNLMYLEDGRIGFLDWGIVGRFDDNERRNAMGFMIALATGNYRQFAEIVISMGSRIGDGEIDVDALAEDLKAAYGPLVGMSMGELNYQEVLPGIMRTSMRHGLKFPQEFILITKQFLYFDRYARLLAPDLNVFSDPRIAGLLMSKLPELAGPEALGQIVAATAG